MKSYVFSLSHLCNQPNVSQIVLSFVIHFGYRVKLHCVALRYISLLCIEYKTMQINATQRNTIYNN